ncbi:EAL domain-containing protein [Anaeromicropila herbilytica]|uniref:EAL domain-containing protein n=1 Tax=Anaeromicropila herbilytica TaxID=2785025 RepID=A0A7R7ICH2_9FIRM|nr:EAL domain-containing protein [Anaeromicropila herbilytica]BCN29914.1 hypothetical protein bsdtb5_12090 [Anaeromicropila herbilytica]
MSIKKILRFTLFIFVTIPIIIFGYFSTEIVAHSLTNSEKEEMKSISASNSNNFFNSINNIEEDLYSLSQINEVVILLKNQISSNINKLPSTINRTKEVENSLISLVKLCPFYRKIDLYNSECTKLISCNGISSYDSNINNKVEKNESLLLNNMKQTKKIGLSLPTHVSKASTKSDTLLIGYPILNENHDTILGYLILNLDIHYFDSFFQSTQNNSMLFFNYATQSIFHINISSNKNNKLNYTLNNDSNSSNYSILVRKLLKAKNISTSSSNRNSNNNIISYKTNNRTYLYAYSILKDNDWAYVVQKESTIPIDVQYKILLKLIIILMCTYLLIYIVSSKITNTYTKPIIKLKDIIQQAAHGNLDVKSDIVSDNEIGELSKSFNQMIHIIKTNYNDLREMHQTLVDKEEELRTNYEQIEYLAYHDTLTKLPNKLTFHNRINQTLLRNINNTHHAVFFIDLDNFKTINDTLGHDYGDRLLAETSARLNSLMTNNDILARAGGDEFLIFRENIDSSEQAITFANDILNEFKNPLTLHKKLVYISMSIGIAIYPENGTTSKTLIKNADIAMYKSKDTGRNKVTLFNKSMQDELSRSAEILEVLRHAIENHEVFLMYQPQVSIISKEIIGYEALMRIQSKTLGILSPTEFIPIAEDSGLIVDLGAWALREACQFTKNLIDESGVPVTVSVNISSIQLNRAGFFTTLADVLDQTELPPECLELEITESSLLYSMYDAATLFKNFQTLGVKIALDDFGTGYSSLNYLTKMPINTLKIDKSFIDNIAANKKDTYIAETIIRLAHNLNIHVIAEGVEDNNQLDILEQYKCDRIQGYLFSKPLNSKDIRLYLEG